jgi:hypothetical protein
VAFQITFFSRNQPNNSPTACANALPTNPPPFHPSPALATLGPTLQMAQPATSPVPVPPSSTLPFPPATNLPSNSNRIHPDHLRHPHTSAVAAVLHDLILLFPHHLHPGVEVFVHARPFADLPLWALDVVNLLCDVAAHLRLIVVGGVVRLRIVDPRLWVLEDGENAVKGVHQEKIDGWVNVDGRENDEGEAGVGREGAVVAEVCVGKDRDQEAGRMSEC